MCTRIILYTWCLSAGDKLNDLLEKIASSLKRESVAYHSVHMTFDFTKYLLQIIACVNSLKVSDSSIAPVIRDIYEHEVNGVLKRGYLVKKGAKRKNWKRRWFVLKSDEMSYYESYETMILKVHIIYLCMYYIRRLILVENVCMCLCSSVLVSICTDYTLSQKPTYNTIQMHNLLYTVLGQRKFPIVNVYLLYKAKKPSVCPYAIFWSSGSPPSVHKSTLNLLDTKHSSSGMMKFIFKSFKSLSNGHMCTIKITHFQALKN